MAITIIDELIVKFGVITDVKELTAFEKRIEKLRKRLSTVGDQLRNVGLVAAGGLAFLAREGIKTDESLRKMQAALNLTTEQANRLKEAAYEIGSGLTLDTADIIEAQRAYGKVGATFDEIQRDLPAIAKAAVATGEPIANIADWTRKAFNTFGIGAKEANEIMLRIENRSPGSVRQFGDALQYSAQTAKDSGLAFGEYIALLGGVAGAGRDPAAVSQGLNEILVRLSKGLTDTGRGAGMVRDTFEGVGIAWEDVQVALDKSTGGNIIKLIKLIQSAGLESDKLTALMASLAGTSYSASLAFAVQNAGDLDRLLAEAGMSAGEMDRQIDIIFSGFFGSLQKMLAMWDTFVNRLSDASISSPLTEVFDSVSNLLVWLTEVDDRGKLVNKGFVAVIGNILLFGTVLLPLGLALKGVSFALGGLVPILKWTGLGFLGVKIKTWLATKAQVAFGTTSLLTATRLGVVALATKAYSLALGIARAGFIAFRTALIGFSLGGLIAGLGTAAAATWTFTAALLANPITWIVLGIAALIAGLVLLVKNWDKVVDSFKFAWQWLSSVPIFGPVIRGIENFIKIVGGVNGAIWGGLVGAWKSVVSWFSNFSLAGAGKAIVKSLADGIISAKDYVVDKIKSIAGSIRRFFGFSDAKEGPLSDITASGRSTLDAFGKGISDSAAKLRRTVAGALGGMALTSAAAAMDLPEIEPQVSQIGEIAPPALPALEQRIEQIGEITAPELPALQQQVEHVGDVATPALPTLSQQVERIGDTALAALPVLEQRVDQVGESADPTLPVLHQRVEQIGDIAAPALPMLRQQVDRVGDLAAPTLPAIQQRVDRVGEFAAPVLPALEQGVEQVGHGLDQGVPSLQQHVERIGGAVDPVLPALQQVERIGDMAAPGDLVLEQQVEQVGETTIPALPALQQQVEQIGAAVAPALPTLHQRVEQVSDADAPSMPDMQQRVERFGETAAPMLPPLEQRVQQVGEYAAPAMPVLEQQIERVGDMATPAMPALQQKIDQIGDFAAPDLPDLQQQIEHISDFAAPVLPDLQQRVDQIGTFVSPDLPDLQQHVEQIGLAGEFAAPALAGGFESLAAPPPRAVGNSKTTINVTVGDISISVPGGDAEEIGTEVAVVVDRQIRDHFRNLARDFDSDVLR